jgi:hypothetical protein
MNKQRFEQNDTYLPVNTEQFEALTNEILTAINEVSTPHFLKGDYLAQILMSAIHAMDHKIGYVKKSDLLDSCINRISCHLTYNVVQDIQAKLKAANGEVAVAPPADAQPVAPAVSLVPDADAEQIG